MKSCISANSTISSKRRGDLALRQAEHDAVDEDVLAPGDLGVEPGAELDERRDAAVRPSTVPVVGLVMPATSLSSVLLPEPLRPMTPSVGPRGTVKVTSRTRGERLVRPQVADQAARQQRALQRRELPAPAVAPVDLRGVGDFDGVHNELPAPSFIASSFARSHTSSANVSLSRSNTKYPNRKNTIEIAPSTSSHFRWPTGPSKNRIS